MSRKAHLTPANEIALAQPEIASDFSQDPLIHGRRHERRAGRLAEFERVTRQPAKGVARDLLTPETGLTNMRPTASLPSRRTMRRMGEATGNETAKRLGENVVGSGGDTIRALEGRSSFFEGSAQQGALDSVVKAVVGGNRPFRGSVVTEATLGSKATLADHVIAAANNPRRELGALAPHLGPASMARLRGIAAQVRAATRTLVDPSAVRAAAALSCQSPTELLAQLRRAAPPAPNVWWEWDERVRMRALVEHGYIDAIDEQNAAHRCGLLVAHGQDGLVRTAVFTQHLALRDVPLIPHMVGFVHHPTFGEHDFKASVDLETQAATAAVHSEEHLAGCSLALGQRWGALHPDDPAYQHMGLRVGYWWPGVPTMLDAEDQRHHDPRAWRQQAKKSAIGVTGDLRFLLALLVLVSVPETIVTDPWTSLGPRAPKGSARLRLPGSVFRTLKLDVPRERVLQRMRDYQPPATPTDRRHRDHPVAPHIAHRRKGYENCVCEHEFDQQEVPRFCTLCGYREWPRKAHRRGDPALGSVFGPRLISASETNR